MATWLNEHEIDEAVEIIARGAPDLAPYAKLLSDWKDVVNENSDGWPYWKAGSKCASRLSALVAETVKKLRTGNRNDLPDVAEMHAALTPIKSAATRHGLPFPVLGEPPTDDPRLGRRP